MADAVRVPVVPVGLLGAAAESAATVAHHDQACAHALRDAYAGVSRLCSSYNNPFTASAVRFDVALTERIEKRIARTDDCWMWTGWIAKNGYGQVQIANKVHAVHRVVYEALVGPIPEGMTLDHLCHTQDLSCTGKGDYCRHRACVNPAHLEPVPVAVNILRGRSPTAINATKVVGICGHPLEWIRKQRDCPICKKKRDRQYYERHKAAIRILHKRIAARHHGSKEPPKNPKAQCKHGHPFSPENTRIMNGSQVCRTCQIAAKRRYR